MENDIEEQQKHDAETRHVHVFLRTAIVFGAVAAGTILTVRALARRHRVSTTSARDALIRLEDEGLVSHQDEEGSVVVSDGPSNS